MALSTKPPAFDRANVEGTVKNLCDYLIQLQEELDFTLEQMQYQDSGVGTTEVLKAIGLK